MSKKILILEPSSTLQAVFSEKTKKSDFELSFDTNGIRFLVTLYNSLPEAILVNARNMNPSCVEFCRLVKNVARFKNIPVGVYATSDFLFSEKFKIDCGADSFINLDPATILEELETLTSKKGTPLATPQENDIIKAGVTEKIFSMIAYLESIPKIASSYLSLLAEICELPAAALFLKTDDDVEGFYVCAEKFAEDQREDFLKVCMSDFEERFVNLNITNLEPTKVDSEKSLENYVSEDLPLSAYHLFSIKGDSGEKFGTVHVVRSGAFTTKQMDLFAYSVRTLSILLKIAVAVRKKMKFEKNIRKAFSRFVPEQIIDELVAGAEKQASVGVGEKRDVAILFSDIRSFTNISERNKPETIVAFLNRYFTIMCTVIKKHGGTVDKFIGDAIMAEFGVPVSYEDNARRAVAAAYEMREALGTVPLEDLVLPEGMNFNIGIGVHYGDVIVGSIGSQDKTDYSVIGDNVNLASRLEGLTKNYGSMILVSEAVKADVKTDEFIFRHLDDVKVKGKANAVGIYAVDRNLEDFSEEYRDSYDKGLALYKKGVWNLAKEYFEKAHESVPDDKAAKLMLSRCEEFIENPPENWDGAISFLTK
ncbi:adenylate/guanylate cyclase domain-containing protein [Treponema zioleckii]|uniref:adenylate/guanylate cyclase domain-containing protein n=1 Tax=Treponema zioleckii TaxID=331680 RepID=UPI00168A94AF|nr:adenylate/guanylate cyclase domain-containing protein [Treponema zioleckii]